jgi:hypothetical protein
VLSTLLQFAAAAALAAASFLIQTSAQASAEPPQNVLTSSTITFDIPTYRVDFSTLEVPYAPSEWRLETAQVFPEFLTAPAALQPTGSLSWAGIDTVGAQEPFWNPRDARSGVFEFVEQSPNLALLVGRPAPEPPAIVMAAFALTAGTVWSGYRRRKKAAATEAGPTEDAVS